MFVLAVQSLGSPVNDTPLSKVMSMPGSVSKSRRSTVTDQDAEEVVVSYDGSLRVMLGHTRFRCLIMRRELDTVMSSPSTDAPTVTRTRLLPHICSRDVERVISMSSFAGTSHSQPVVTVVQVFVVSVIVVPMLEVAVIKNVAWALLLLESLRYQFPMWVSGTLSALTTSTSKFEVSSEAVVALDSVDVLSRGVAAIGKW